MSKYKEWWIAVELGKEHEDAGSWDTQIFTTVEEGTVHVIEYSAYEAAIRGINLQQDEIVRLRKERDELKQMISRRLRELLAIAEKALEKIATMTDLLCADYIAKEALAKIRGNK